ncbi:tRNA uridine-5-carboxymethylaminomethyl(34) synthesis GTPase MnmE [Breoghania sp.]|uniref:tRNA uridine-5-carboxymethylaminomethyl(34) synthesis GTPase MnmE n=1 Tax=Breoghania sp. TaxID=2065378 RepID=UPI002635AAA7|nr:tRNA uridine-5-carboxymethylaminomethyl(34) synthesis GTPase MnmE [Breoghania sp.]MDJ0930422.1 tRNA uridine-5-carboxymethylaminomethyl(34) synthesis GTPase MnmE [Breoghania sp.]
MSERETIYALSSGDLPSGVAVVRISGPRVRFVVETLCGSLPAPRRASVRKLRDPAKGEVLDEALVLFFERPASFTGEDVVEFHLHGGRAVVAAVLSALETFEGVTPAEAGAFTRRAFEAGRLDLTEVEGLGDLIQAETEAQRRQAIRQMGGELGALYESWRTVLVCSRAMIEAEFDFADEDDVPRNASDAIWENVIRIRDEISNHLVDNRRGERLRSGLQVVLLGPPNAGKSSLLNALARREVAIVTEEAGTTRDLIEVHLDLGGYPVTVVDTAGLREEGAGVIEREGMRRALVRAGTADLVLWLNPAGQERREEPAEIKAEQIRVVRLATKADLVDVDLGEGEVPCSVKASDGLGPLLSELEGFANDMIGQSDSPVVTRARHRCSLRRCLEGLNRALEGGSWPLELRAEDLRVAGDGLGRIVGKTDVEDLLDVIFRDFCIGK